MNDLTSARFALPLLAAAQAQKETWHNEALTLIDALMQCMVEGVADTPPMDAAAGTCWIVGAVPDGEWAGRAGQVAAWTTGGWRFVAPPTGMIVRTRGGDAEREWTGSAWVPRMLAGTGLRVDGLPVVGARHAAIAVPTGGSVVDGEARGAIAAILAALAGHGLIGPTR